MKCAVVMSRVSDDKKLSFPWSDNFNVKLDNKNKLKRLKPISKFKF